MERPSWDEYFIDITELTARRSTCLRRSVGAVLVIRNKIWGTGYNGVPSGLRHCEETGCERMKQNIPSGMRHEICRGLHAENNAIRQALRKAPGGEKPLENAVLYCTNHPCNDCAKMIVDEGIKRIVILSDYADEEARKILKEAKVEIEIFKKDKGGN